MRIGCFLQMIQKRDTYMYAPLICKKKNHCIYQDLKVNTMKFVFIRYYQDCKGTCF